MRDITESLGSPSVGLASIYRCRILTYWSKYSTANIGVPLSGATTPETRYDITKRRHISSLDL